MDFLTILRLIFGAIFVLFLPGLVWSFVFFKKDEIDLIERIALSFGLSIALVPLCIFWLNYFLGVKITLFSVSLVILVLIALALGLIKNRNEIKAYLKRHGL